MIDVDNVSKSYGSTVVVDGVSLSLPRGGVVSIVGANGAGKSTLLALISRLLPADSGRVRIDGLDVATAPGDQLAKRMSILRQDNHAIARLTVRDLVAFGRYPHSKGRLTALDRAQVDRFLAYLDLESLAGRFLDELSGGQRQRAYIAMVLCQDTDYILLDEPLNTLDIRHAVALMTLFRRTAGELDKTFVIVLHDINFASCYSDHIIAMRDGRVVHQGAPAEIITPSVIADVFGLETTVQEVGGRPIVHYYR